MNATCNVQYVMCDMHLAHVHEHVHAHVHAHVHVHVYVWGDMCFRAKNNMSAPVKAS